MGGIGTNLEQRTSYFSAWGKLKKPRPANGLIEIQIGTRFFRIHRSDPGLKKLKPTKLKTKVMVIFSQYEDGILRIVSSVPTDSYRWASELQEVVRQGGNLESKIGRIFGAMVRPNEGMDSRSINYMYQSCFN